MKKNVRFALMAIFGINIFRANLVCSLAGLSKDFKMKHLSEFYFNVLAFLLKRNFWTELDLKEQRIRNVSWLIDTQSYRGLRYEQHLPHHARERKVMLRQIKKGYKNEKVTFFKEKRNTK
jgi:ribosomal protein S13